jgi:integrase
VKPLNREEIAHLLAAAKEKMPHWYPFFLTAARTGLRLGELLALKWENVDLHSRLIVVSQAMSRGKIGTKSGKSREVHMSQQLTDTLRALHLRCREEALAKGLIEIPEFVFSHPRRYAIGGGQPLTQQVLARLEPCRASAG